MKKARLIYLASILLASVIFTGCGGLKKMIKRAGEVEYKVVPEVLEMHADSVDVTITVKFPAKYFHKKAIVEATPVLRWNGGEKEFKMEARQGEAVEDNHKVIGFADGGSWSYNDKIAFEDVMRVSELYIKLKGTIKSKEAEIANVKIADGVIATPGLVMYDARAIFAPDKFVRTTSESKEADIHYVINQYDIRSSETKADDIKELKGFIEEAKENERRQFKGIEISSYASPDGPLDLNEKLSKNRGGAAEKFMKNEFKKVTEAEDKAFVKSETTSEDWDGFKNMMQASDVTDKELILKVLSMYPDNEVREKEIKNISKVYLEVADKVLPKLRRSQMKVKIDVVGYSDEEITAIADSKPDSLKVEELLYAASLTNDFNKKLKIYKDFVSIYPKDWRGPNNVGYCYIKLGKVADAKKAFEDAKTIDNGNTTISNNLGAVAIREADFAKAKEYLESAAGAGKEVSYNWGIISIKEAGMKTPDYDYNEAVTYFGSDCSFNAALAKLLAGDIDNVTKTVDCAENKDQAMMYYLKAIVGARQGDSDILFNNLRTAVEKDGSLAGKAKTDMEFRKYFEDSTFKSIAQ